MAEANLQRAHLTSQHVPSYGAVVDPTAANELAPLLDDMDEKIGISTTALASTDNLLQKSAKLPQYAAALSVTLGAFALGTALAWTSPTSNELEESLGSSNWSWIGSLMALGAACVVLPIGYLIDKFGRKNTMLALVLPFIGGWALMVWAEDNVAMYMVGRFITGMMGGAFSLTAPVYTSEIAEKEIRGALGSYFQLMVTIGILFTYGIGSAVKAMHLSMICGFVPLVFGVIFIFMPETPLYHLQKGEQEKAKASLQWFRGRHYNVDKELQELQAAVDDAAAQRTTFRQAFSSKAARRALFIGFGLMIFQQLSGVNAVIFYTTSIFESAKSSLTATECTIIVGVIQVIATFVSTLIVDRLGRRILLMISDCVMAICALLLGIFFYMKDEVKDDVESYSWLPLVSVCLFMVVFSLGYGPIPWMMMGELFSPQIKGIASSSACLLNWILAFLVTKFYSDLVLAIESYSTFWIFAGVSAVGTVFVLIFVPETKGKSMDDIQRELGEGLVAPSLRSYFRCFKCAGELAS